MVRYLKFHGASPSLIEQTEKYKMQLWKIKDGILNTQSLRQLPTPLQMELIFDINVGHFHESLLFRDCGEPSVK